MGGKIGGVTTTDRASVPTLSETATVERTCSAAKLLRIRRAASSTLPCSDIVNTTCTSAKTTPVTATPLLFSKSGIAAARLLPLTSERTKRAVVVVFPTTACSARRRLVTSLQSGEVAWHACLRRDRSSLAFSPGWSAKSMSHDCET